MRWGEERIVGGKEKMEPREAINCGREKPQIVAPGSQYKNGSSSLGAPWEELFLEAFGRAPEEGRGGGGRGGVGRRHMRLGGERGSWWKGEDTNCGCFLGEAIF